MQISLMEYLTQINANNANLGVQRVIPQTQHPLQNQMQKNQPNKHPAINVYACELHDAGDTGSRPRAVIHRR